MTDRKSAIVAWDGEWSDGYRGRVVIVETERYGKTVVLEHCVIDAVGNESWRPWPSSLPDLPCIVGEAFAALAALLKHCWIHSGYRDCGYLQMTTAQKFLFKKVARGDSDPDSLLRHLLDEEDAQPDPPASYGDHEPPASSFGSDP